MSIFSIVAKDTIDEYVYNVIEKKRIEINKVIDNEDYESNTTETILSQFLNQLKLFILV